MRKVYLDITQASMCISVCVRDAEVILAGTTVSSMSVRQKNTEYQRFAEEYDIHFIFDDNVPKVDFYTVPMVEIFAEDSQGGYLGSLGQPVNLQEDIPICYMDKDRKCYLIAENGRDFLAKVSDWRSGMALCQEVEFFESKEDAQKKYEFLDRVSIEQELRDVEN